MFKLTPWEGSWTETVLYNFTGGADGLWPWVGLTPDEKGNFYGTTFHNSIGPGVVFEVTSSGIEKAFYDFLGGANGGYPWGTLIRDKKGNLYGTTEYDGTNGCGTVFKLAPDGTETVLYSFVGGGDGYWPEAGLVLDKEGNLYGTTAYGGGSGCGGSGCGTVFEVTPTGTEMVLHSFDGADGAYPDATMVFDAKGNLYGTTWGGGAYGWGAVFELTPSGAETVLYSFCSAGYPCPDGFSPNGSLLRKDGVLYGTTVGGGPNKAGTVFALNPKKRK